MKSARAKAYVHPARWDLVEQALDEGDFLWRRRQRAITAPDHNLADVARFVEERLLGCIDGLRVGGNATIEKVLAPALEGDDSTRSIAALALAGGGDAELECLAAALRDAPADELSPLARGIELWDSPDLVARLEGGLEVQEASPEVRAAFLEICAFRRQTPGAPLHRLAAGGEKMPALQQAALTAARFFPSEVAGPFIAGALDPSSPAGAAAVESGLVLGIPGAAPACAEALRSLPESALPFLTPFALGVTSERERHRLVDALGVEALAEAAVWALGFAGTREAADACVELIQQERHARLAFEALCAITGADPEKLRAADRPSEPDAPLPPIEEDDLTADLTLDQEELLPEPDAAAVARWWDQNRARLAPGTRYLLGQPNDASALWSALLTAPMRRRGPLALDLAIQTRGANQLNPSALCREQRQTMRSWQSAQPRAPEPRKALPRRK